MIVHRAKTDPCLRTLHEEEHSGPRATISFEPKWLYETKCTPFIGTKTKEMSRWRNKMSIPSTQGSSINLHTQTERKKQWTARQTQGFCGHGQANRRQLTVTASLTVQIASRRPLGAALVYGLHDSTWPPRSCHGDPDGRWLRCFLLMFCLIWPQPEALWKLTMAKFQLK